jgi:hypothetical protein
VSRSLIRFVVSVGVIVGCFSAPLSAQFEIAVGGLAELGRGPDETRFGPLASIAMVGGPLPKPVRIGVSVARTDFSLFGQDYHDDHYHFFAGGEWSPMTGATQIGLQLQIGAYREIQTVETDPPRPGGDNWIETVSTAIVLERQVSDNRSLVFTLTDVVLGPWFAVLDPSEYGVEHRLHLTVGLRF